MLWRAISYRLFAGSAHSPRMSLLMRSAAFGIGIAALGALSYTYAPRLAVTYPLPHLLPLLFAGCVSTVMMVSIIAEMYQSSLLERLKLLQYLPLTTRQVRRAYAYAALPVGLVVTALAVPAITAIFSHSLRLPVLALVAFIYSGGALLYDALLRTAYMHNAWRYGARGATLIISLSLARMLFLSGQHITIWLWATTLFAILWVVFLVRLSQMPVRTDYAMSAIPVIEGRPTLITQVTLRAMRIGRYVGTNILLLLVIAGVAGTSLSRHATFPVDGALLLALLLIGTLGQEARAISHRRYPTELTMYAMPLHWLVATWILTVINALIYIDVCLAVIIAWAPYGLSISYMQAGYMGIALVGAGIISGSVIVPQKRDILAQCASTALYAGCSWGLIKLFSRTLDDMRYAVLGVAVLLASMIAAYLCERIRWIITVRRWRRDAFHFS